MSSNQKKITGRVETITPRKAKKWLENKAPNRPVDLKYVAQLRDSIDAGEWELTNESIGFNLDGQLQDGQHRCEAVVASGKSIECWVMKNVPDRVFDKINIGKRRSIAGILHRHGETNTSVLGSALSWVWRYRMDIVYQGRSASPRISQALELLKEVPDLRRSSSLVRPCRSFMSQAMAAALHFIFCEKCDGDSTLPDEFFEKLGSGEGLSSKDRTCGILKLRNLLQREHNRESKIPQDGKPRRKTKTNLDPDYVWAVSVKAWNSFKNGEVIGNLKYSQGIDNFPEIK
jgi:hypothetical protein